MPDPTPILICYDRSPGARRAIALAGRLFHGRSAVVLHVWTPLSVMFGAYALALPPGADDEAVLAEAGLAVAQEGAALAREAGLDATADAVPGSASGTWHEILDVADQCDAELILLGARGLSPLRAIVLGSVSQGVVQHAHRPVLVVPPAGGDEEALLGGGMAPR